MPDEARPSGDEVQREYDHLREVWSAAHRNWATYDSYRERTYEVWPRVDGEERSGRPSYRPSTPTSTVDAAINNFMSFHPKIHRDPIGTGEAHQRRSDAVELGLQAIMEDSALREDYIPAREGAGNLIYLGYVVYKGPVLVDPYLRPPRRYKGETDEEYDTREMAFQAHKNNWNPIRYRTPHPAQVLLNPFEGKQPTRAVEIQTMCARDVQDLTARKSKSRKYAEEYHVGSRQDPYETLTLLHYWTESWHHVKLLDGEDLYTERNPLGYVPFIQAYAGFGRQSTSSDKVDPSSMAVGILHSTMDTIRLQAQRSIARHQLLMSNAFAQIRSSREPTEVAQQLQRGDIIHGDEGDFGIMPTPQIQSGLADLGSEYEADIELGTSVRDLMGRRQPGVITVGQQGMINAQAQKKYTAPSIQNEHLWSIMGTRTLQVVDSVLKQTIGTKGKLLRPTDIEHFYPVRVSFGQIDVIMEMELKRIGMAEADRRIISKADYRQNYARIENETEADLRLLQELYEEDPFLVQVKARKFAQAIGDEEDYEESVRLRDEMTRAKQQRPSSERLQPQGPPQGPLPGPPQGQPPGQPPGQAPGEVPGLPTNGALGPEMGMPGGF